MLIKFKRSIDLISSIEHVSDVRLPRDIAPVGYILELQPFFDEKEFQGHVTINITCMEDTDKIILNAHQELDISESDITVVHISSNMPVKKSIAMPPPVPLAVPLPVPATNTPEKTIETTTPATTTTTTTATTEKTEAATTIPTTKVVKTTEPAVAPVPVGAARLVPVSSSFIPENACTSATACATNPGQEKDGDKPPKTQSMPKAEALVDVHDEADKFEVEKESEEVETIEEGGKSTQLAKGEILETIPENLDETQTIALTILKTERQLSKQWYVIHVAEGLKRGQNYQMDLKFTGPLLSNSKDGFFLESYLDKQTGEKRQYVATQLRPNHARRVFPCFDEPAYKVPIELKIARHPNMSAISNMPIAQTVQGTTETDCVWDHFQTTPPISAFSLAILISDLEQVVPFKNRQNDEKSDRVKVWGRKGILTPLKNAAKIAPKVLVELEEFFDIPLPVPKLDLVALPGYTAIPDSNWGLIFFKESDLYTDEHLVKHISREIVYQWVGNLVTPHWWSEVHLNKALCNFIAYIISLKIDLSMVPNSSLWTKTYPLYYEYGRNKPYKQLPSQKPPKTVTKSELILRMLNYTLSSETFQKAIQQLLRNRQHKTFTQEDIWNSLTEQAGTDGNLPEPATISQIASSWINKERLPLVEFKRFYGNNSAEAVQSVFIRDHLDENTTSVDDNLTWQIPLVIVPQNNLNFDTTKPVAWMKDEKRIIVSDLPSSNYFVIVNPEEIGPFVVNYDVYNWNLLAGFLEKFGTNGQIPAATRAKLIHDCLNLAYAGKLRFDVALNVTKFLLNERDPIVWQAAFNMFDHIQRHLDGSETGKKFQEYVKYILSNVYNYLEKIGTNQTKSQERMYKSAKSALCNAGFSPCVNEARTQWKKWMEFEEPDSGIPISQSHFCWVFKWGTKEEWEFGLERYLKYPSSHKQADRYYLLKTLVSCPSDAWNVERLLNMTMLDPNSTITDGNARFILSVLSNRAGYTALFNLLSQNWDVIRKRFDNKEYALWDNLVNAATRHFKDQEGLDMVSELYVKRQGEFGTAEPVIEQSLKHIKKEVRWNDENLSIINNWLNEYLKLNESSSQMTGVLN
ncbi:hypothetical protein RUM44_005080 [Polyplax serrata]|uniref:Aminopeptidase n=1 Tax=Polyplax serrata TaxID=468196 RepID=A0ABR1AE02_POLSC